MPEQLKRFIKATRDFSRRGRNNPKHFEEQSTEAILAGFEKAMPLAASTLSLPDVEKIFGLKEDPRYRSIWHLDDHDLIPVPESLCGSIIWIIFIFFVLSDFFSDEKLAEISSILGQDPTNEATCRLRLNAILFDCIKAERALLASPQQARCDEGLSKKPVSLMLESHLYLEVQFKKSRRLLQGKSDYSVWYDDMDMATNLVIVQAKTRGVAGSGITQCLAYMGRLPISPKRKKGTWDF